MYFAIGGSKKEIKHLMKRMQLEETRLFDTDNNTQLLDYVFPDHDNIDKTKLKLTNVSLYSVAGKKHSKKLCDIIYSELKTYDITITDMTSNVGSESIALTLAFNKVNAIEIDKLTYKLLNNNIDVYGLSNIKTYNGDSSKIIGELTQDVIYFDPPWGGPDYYKQKYMDMYLGDKNIIDIIVKNINKVKCIVARLPINYNFQTIISNNKITKCVMYNMYNNKGKIKYHVAVIY